MINKIYAKLKIRIGVLLMNYTFFLVEHSEKNACWRLICNCHKIVLGVLNISFYPIESTISYYNKYNTCTIHPIKTNRKGYVTASAFDIKESLSYLEEKKLPDLNLYHFSNVFIQGNSDMVVDRKNGCVINDFCYNLDRFVKFVDGLLYQIKSNVCILRSNLRRSCKIIQSGVMINGKFSNNYYHEILENLIKLIVISDLEISPDIPIIIDSSVKKVSAFGFILSKLTLKQPRKVIYINYNELCLVNDLYVISNINHITPHLIGRSILKEDMIFDIDILRRLREKLLSWKSGDETPRKIFLTRKNTKHRNFNEKDIIRVLEPLGFVAIAPEDYSFQQQMFLFNDADIIIGGTGAAFTNLLFVKENSKIIIITPNVDGEPSAFSVLARMNGCKLLYYRSDEIRHGKSIHSDYFVNPSRFDYVVKCFLEYEG